jgi:hypothetical protein
VVRVSSRAKPPIERNQELKERKRKWLGFPGMALPQQSKDLSMGLTS